MSRPSLRAAINAMCRRCIYDPHGGGNWREQVGSCSAADCPLHPLRPISGSRTSKQSLPCVSGSEALASRLPAPENRLEGIAMASSRGAA